MCLIQVFWKKKGLLLLAHFVLGDPSQPWKRSFTICLLYSQGNQCMFCREPECQPPRTPLMMLNASALFETFSWFEIIWNIFSYGISGHTWEFDGVLRQHFPCMINSNFLKGQWNSTLVVPTKFYPLGVHMENTETEWLFKAWLFPQRYGFIKVLSGWDGVPVHLYKSREKVFMYCLCFFSKSLVLRIELYKKSTFPYFICKDHNQIKALAKITFLWDSHLIVRAKYPSRLDSSV